MDCGNEIEITINKMNTRTIEGWKPDDNKVSEEELDGTVLENQNEENNNQVQHLSKDSEAEVEGEELSNQKMKAFQGATLSNKKVKTIKKKSKEKIFLKCNKSQNVSAGNA